MVTSSQSCLVTSASWIKFKCTINDYNVQSFSRSSVEQYSIARHCCPLSLHLLLSSQITSLLTFFIPLSDSSLICRPTVPAQWLVILDTIIAFTFSILFKVTNHCVGTVQMREESESRVRKWEEMWFKTTAEDGEKEGTAVICYLSNLVIII